MTWRNRKTDVFDLSRLASKRRWRREEAREALEAHRRSGLSLVAFALRHSLEVKRLYRWRQSLKAARGVAPSAPVRFVRVTVRPAQIDPAGMEILLDGGRRIRVAAGFDPDVLASLVQVLESMPC